MDNKEIEEKVGKSIREIIKKEGNEGIIRFDIRNRVFREIALENKETRKELEDDYDRYCKGDIIVKTCIGKKWAPKLDYDYDDSLYANYIYWKTNSIFQKKCFIENSQDSKGKEKKYEYIICSEGKKYRGDVMNSWRRTLNEFIRVCGREYVYGYRGKCIPEGYDSWECFLAKEENYKKSLPTYIIEFMDVVYTIGNFMPVLYGEKRINFNTRRPLYTRDYWDLTLLAIYNYYDEKYSKGEGEELQLKSLFKEKEIKEWLDKFVDWNGFVKENFMQPFVKKIDKDKGNYSAPHLKYIDFYAKRRK